ncbi:uncharacterized protein BX664DRAFT_344035 [Halteromyces radiatus]|uniref:uncharacterized protein n=1 Tax=Halteromyces radiatus TaxID=101107 RepID=UPI00221E43F1|nr:uncharacterized protein BX664DRAFT_344035 [Halteromyces radiatus]KAI8076820.1 hypothetical protein BX664DRAFT_344035 [Halteromyces radiatus]
MEVRSKTMQTEQQKQDEENTRLLNELHQNEKALNDSIRDQLEKARKTKATMEADLESRAQEIKLTLGNLQTNESDNELTRILSINDEEILKTEIQKLFTQCRQQQSRIKKLEFDVEMEQGHVNILRHDNQTLKQLTVNMTQLAEQEEEYISNKLLKRITGLKKEKSELLLQVEQEEEYMTNMLQKKLNRLQKEKIDMENALEQEQEFIVNKLQKQLDALKSQQPKSTASSPRTILQDATGNSISTTPGASPALPTHPSPSLSAKKWNTNSGNSSGYNDPSSSMIEMLLAEVASLKSKTSEMEKEFLHKTQQCNKYKVELVQFRKQNNMPIDDIPLDEGIPAVFRSIPPSPGRQVRAKRSTSTSSQRSVTSEKTGSQYGSIPPLQLDSNCVSSSSPSPHHQHDYSSTHSTVGPQSIPTSGTPRSRSSKFSYQLFIYVPNNTKIMFFFFV